MTPSRQDWARGRGQPNREPSSRRLLPGINPQPRMNAQRADGTRTKAGPVGLSDPSYAYLGRSHD